jgi:hypothetical protein
MMISMHLGIPTVNGYSGFEPHAAFTLPTRGMARTGSEWRMRCGHDAICELDQTAAFVPTAAQSCRTAFYLASLLEMPSTLHDAASRFLADGHTLDLHPRFDEHGIWILRSA